LPQAGVDVRYPRFEGRTAAFDVHYASVRARHLVRHRRLGFSLTLNQEGQCLEQQRAFAR
jgi:hypothetical protein